MVSIVHDSKQKESTSARSVPPLPSSYTPVPPDAPNTKEFKAPVVDAPVRPPHLRLADEATDVETKLLTTLMAALRKGSLTNGDWISWSAYHAHTQQAVITLTVMRCFALWHKLT